MSTLSAPLNLSEAVIDDTTCDISLLRCEYEGDSMHNLKGKHNHDISIINEDLCVCAHLLVFANVINCLIVYNESAIRTVH